MNTHAPRFNELVVHEVVQETPDAVVVTFSIPNALKKDYAFDPGQYVTLRATIDGEDVRRSYSICSAAGAENLSVGIKSLPGGVFSNFAQHLQRGDRLSVMTPQGRFTAPLGGEHNYLMLAAGSGITPMMSIAQSVLAEELDSTVTLFYANRNTQNIMFRQSINDLKDQYMTRFLLTHVMDEESQDVELFNGRLDAEKLDSLQTAGLIRPEAYDAIYVCGPEPMIVTVCNALEQQGVDPALIKRELFTASTPPPAAGQRRDTLSKGNSESVVAEVEVLLDGSYRSFPINSEETLISAAARSGFEIPYSCANGMCATCRCKLTGGSATMTQNFSLDPWEIEEGYVLACQLQPTSGVIKLDFDAV